MKATCPPVSGYSADTEILTRRQGWITLDQLTCLDEVATRSPDGLFTWQHPDRVGWQQYEGEMIRLHSRILDLKITPDTPVTYLRKRQVMSGGVRRAAPPAETIARARELVGRQRSLVASSRWEPPEPPAEFSLIAERSRLGRPGNNFAARTPDFAAYMGMYLAEGNLNYGSRKHGRYVISVWQKTGGRGFREFDDLITRIWGRPLPRSPKGCWYCTNKALFTYLAPCGRYAWTKTIPPEVLDLSRPLLERFWEYFCLGDGTSMQAAGRKPLDVISTTSKTMAGQFQEVLQKLGGWGMIQRIDYSKYPSKLGVTRHMTYRLVRRKGTMAFASMIEAVPYVGMIGSVEVGGPIYVRRNYRPVWSGA